MRYSLARDGEPQLAFDGDLITTASSAARGKRNWTELSLYRTNGGSFVVQTIARTTKPDEVEWFSARHCVTAADAIAGLRDRRRKTLSKLALGLLEQAACQDDDISEALDAIEGTEEEVT